MASIKAQILPTSKKGKESKIHLRLIGPEFDVVAPSTKTVKPEYWNVKSQECKSSVFYKTESDRILFNEDLNSLKSHILKAVDKVDKKDVDKVWLQSEIDKFYNPEKFKPVEEVPQTMFEFIEQFIKEAPHRTGKKDGTLISAKAVTQYQISFDYLKEFAKYKKKKSFEYAEMNKAFYDSYIKFLQSKDLASNTIGAKIKHLKLFLNNAPSVGVYDKVDIQQTFKVFKKAAENVALDEAELQKIYELDFSGPNTKDALVYKELIEKENVYSSRLTTLDAVRDGFLLECWTGSRFGDLTMITKENLQANGTIKYIQSKTGTLVVIPLHPISKAILEKYNYTPPQPVSNQKFNEIIKIICRIAEINGAEKKNITKGGKKQTNHYEKWQLISSHTGRRSFATNCYRMGVPTMTIMSITGHTTESSFLTYIKVGKDEHAQKMMEHWNRIYSGDKN